MPDAEYFSLSGLSASALKQFDKSPSHYKYYVNNKQDFVKAFLDGRVAHAKILENKDPKLIEYLACKSADDKLKIHDFFKKNISEDNFNTCFPGGKITAAGRDQAFDIGNYYTEKEYQNIMQMHKSVKNHPIGKHICNNPKNAELVSIVTCPRTGLKLKAKFDYVPQSGNVLFDLKTIAEIKENKIKYTIKDLKYHIQACHYLYVAELANRKFDQFVFVFVEKKPPFGVLCVKLEDDFIIDCMDYYHTLLDNFALCKKMNDFSKCYDEEIKNVSFNLYT